MKNSSPLFSSARLSFVLQCRTGKIADALRSMPPAEVLATTADDYTAVRFAQLRLDRLSIPHEAPEQVETFEKVEPFRDHGRTGRIVVAYTVLALPFKGDKDLFEFTPNAFTLSPPAGYIEAGEVRHAFVLGDNTERQGDAWAGALWNAVESQNRDIDEWERELPRLIRESYIFRRNEAEVAAAASKSLRFKIRRREDAPAAYSVPLQRKSLAAKPAPQAPVSPLTPAEAVLAESDYNEILALIFSMALVFERSPSVFSKITEEEEIRMLLLIPLNGVYASATAETFNGIGKSDILIRHEGKNLFVGECKFWKGPKGFEETLGQLFGYLTWRDCKAAILLFVRDTSMSTVVAQIPTLLQANEHFHNALPATRDGEFRALFQRKDTGAQFTVTVLCFHIPGKTQA